MKKVAIITVLLSFTFILTACNDEKNHQAVDTGELSFEKVELENSPAEIEAPDNAVKILSIDTGLEEQNNWLIVPKDMQELTISVEAENVDTVLFWLVEPGTGTWNERRLIGYDKDVTDGFTLDWELGGQIFHHYITVQALGSDYSTQTSETLNIHTDEE